MAMLLMTTPNGGRPVTVVVSMERKKKIRVGEALSMESNGHPTGEDLKETEKKKGKRFRGHTLLPVRYLVFGNGIAYMDCHIN